MLNTFGPENLGLNYSLTYLKFQFIQSLKCSNCKAQSRSRTVIELTLSNSIEPLTSEQRGGGGAGVGSSLTIFVLEETSARKCKCVEGSNEELTATKELQTTARTKEAGVEAKLKSNRCVYAHRLFDVWSQRNVCLNMQRKSTFLRFNQPFTDYDAFGHTLFGKSCYMWVQIMHKVSGGRRPKQKIYHRVYELDRVMDLQKKPSLILKLKSIIQSQKSGALLLRDLEKEVGFVQKWNYMAVIEKYPTIFRVSGGNRTPPMVSLTEKAARIAAEEDEARQQMEPIVVKNLRKLLMLSVDCRLPLESIDFIESELGLPIGFKNSLIPNYPDFFSVKEVNGRAYLELENWDSSLAITAREERLDPDGYSKRARISKDGNFAGPYAFQLRFPAGFRPNMSYLEELEKWQKMEFPSPYLNARRFDVADPKARKRVVAVLHELLSLTMEKRLTSAQLDSFHAELRLPAKLLLCLIKHHAMFYITNKGAKSMVVLKEAYDGSSLIDKCPLLLFRDKFVALTGRREVETSSQGLLRNG